MVKVSIIIPSYNGRELLEKNLPKVIEACRGNEIIVVDDGSIDGTGEFLKSNFPQVKTVAHQKNLRFSAACNSGVKKAKGEIVVLLNNDVIPQKGFLKPLIKNFKDKDVFSVGCKEIGVRNGKKIVSGRNEAEFKRGFLIHRRAKNQNRKDTFWTFGGSMAVDRKKYLEIGGMDTIYKPAYWEDIDLCWRARKKGWKILFEPKAIVYHQHETTNIKELGKREMAIAAYKNQILFVWKNIRGWQLIQHFLWLPYHLVFSTLRSKGLFLIGFLKALFQLLNFSSAILILAFILRLFRLTKVPPSLSWDEAAIGYNAWTILTTGRDEFGISFPLAFKSFGDYKSPLLIYLTAPFVGIFGLNELAVRLPSALIGALTVVIIYFLTKELFKDKKLSRRAGSRLRGETGLIASFLLAVSPWHLQFSRAAFEGNLALFLVVLGAWLFLKALKSPKFYVLSFLFFILSLYSYHSPKIFLPFYLLTLTVIFRKTMLRKKNIKYLGLSLILGLALIFPLLKLHLSGQAGARLVSTGIFYTQEGEKKPLSFGILAEIGKNYLIHFSPKFWFLGVNENFRNGIRETGLFYWTEMPFLLIGFISLIKQRKKKWAKFLFIWLLLAPLPATVTLGAPHRLRALNMLIPLIIIASLGIMKLFAFLKDKKYKRVFCSLFSVLCFFNLGYYFYSYHFHYPLYAAKDWQYGYKEMALYLKDKEERAEQIIITDNYGQPHIFIQFFQKKKPLEIWSSAKYLFQKINWEQDKELKNAYLVVSPEEVPLRAIPLEFQSKIVKEINFPDGTVAFGIFKL